VASCKHQPITLRGCPPVSFDSILQDLIPHRTYSYAGIFDVQGYSVRSCPHPEFSIRGGVPEKMSSGSRKPSVLLVDDHPALLQQAIQLLQNDFEVVGTLRDGSGLAEMLARRPPDAIVLDITLPGQSGLKLAQALKDAGCAARIVFLTAHSDADYARAALSAGAAGYVLKPRMASDLVLALHAALRGGRFISPCAELEGVK
jgi:CheY-like chemotaxis protein